MGSSFAPFEMDSFQWSQIVKQYGFWSNLVSNEYRCNDREELFFKHTDFNCMLFSCQVRVSERIWTL